jgi:hypothetical protein
MQELIAKASAARNHLGHSALQLSPFYIAKRAVREGKTGRPEGQDGPYGQTKHGGMAWESPGVNKKYRRPRSACRCLWPRRHIGTTGRPTSNKKQETAYFHAFITRNEGKFAIFAKVMLLRRQPTQPPPG